MKKKKRTTFLQLMTKSGIVALIATAIFSGLFHEILLISTRQNVYTESGRLHSSIMSQISSKSNDYDDPFRQIGISMNLYTYCNVWFFNTYDVQLASDMIDDCHAVSLLIDEDNNIVASSKESLTAIIKFDDNDKAGYICDKDFLNNPQVDELYSVYNELAKNNDYNAWVDVVVDSAYVDRENYIFIPHECRLEVTRMGDDVLDTPTTLESREVKIDISDSNYELITFDESDVNAVPHIFLEGFRGTDENYYNEHISNVNIETTSYCINADEFVKSESSSVWIDGKEYTLYTACIVNEKSPLITSIYIKAIVIFLLVSLFIALMWSWYRNTKNKARYAFEDYQKTLINNLSHDLKTPLTAISGYAENARHSNEITEITSYLDSICTNVMYMDSIVNRTLELNHIQEIKVKKETVDMCSLVKKALEKYSLMLDEKHITTKINGECSFSADKNTIETAVENLVSNAVKYTHENGSINIIAEKNSFTITNDIMEQVDVENLIMPFVKSDKSRNEKSSGLGLAIVQNCADINGLRFSISSTENKFTAVIKK